MSLLKRRVCLAASSHTAESSWLVTSYWVRWLADTVFTHRHLLNWVSAISSLSTEFETILWKLPVLNKGSGVSLSICTQGLGNNSQAEGGSWGQRKHTTTVLYHKKLFWTGPMSVELYADSTRRAELTVWTYMSQPQSPRWSQAQPGAVVEKLLLPVSCLRGLNHWASEALL